MNKRQLCLSVLVAAGVISGCSDQAGDAEEVASISQALSVCDEDVPADHYIDGIPAYAQCGASQSSAIYSNNGVDTSTSALGDDWVRTQWSGGYQCTEYAGRFLIFRWDIDWRPNGNAGEWCNTQPPSDSGLEQTSTPVHGDVLVFAPGVCGASQGTGHVAVVDTVDAENSRVTIVEQNPSNRRSCDQSCATCFLHATANDGSEGTGGAGGEGGAAPATGGAEPATGGAEPATGGAEPAAGGAEPATGGADSATGGAEPPAGGAAPATGGAAPATGGAEPATGGAAPATGGAEPATGGAAPATGGAAPATGGAAPATGGAEPATDGTPLATGGAPLATGGAEPATGGAALAASGAAPGAGGAATTAGGVMPVAGRAPLAADDADATTGSAGTGTVSESGHDTDGVAMSGAGGLGAQAQVYPQDDGGCGCRIPAKSGSPNGGTSRHLTLALLGLVLLGRARPRRSALANTRAG